MYSYKLKGASDDQYDTRIVGGGTTEAINAVKKLTPEFQRPVIDAIVALLSNAPGQYNRSPEEFNELVYYWISNKEAALAIHDTLQDPAVTKKIGALKVKYALSEMNNFHKDYFASEMERRLYAHFHSGTTSNSDQPLKKRLELWLFWNIEDTLKDFRKAEDTPDHRHSKMYYNNDNSTRWNNAKKFKNAVIYKGKTQDFLKTFGYVKEQKVMK